MLSRHINPLLSLVATASALLPQFFSGSHEAHQYASKFTLDLNQTAPSADLLRAQMQATYQEHGAVLLTNTNLSEFSQMRAYVANVLTDSMEHYTGGANPRDALEPFFFEVGAPAEADLHYHHEMAYVSTSVDALAFSCRAALSGNEPNGVKRGATFLSDSLQVTTELLETELGRKLRDTGLVYWRMLTDGASYGYREDGTVYNHWQKSFGTSDPEQAQRIAESRGLTVEWGTDPNKPAGEGGRYMVTKYKVSAFEYSPKLNRNLIYSSIADDAQWFDSWPGLAHVDASKRPLKLTFGDDSELTPEEWRQFVEIYDRAGFPIEWSQGDVLVFDNYRYAHGRPGYKVADGEKRELGVTLGKAFTRVGDVEGKWR